MKTFLANTLELMLHQWALWLVRHFPRLGGMVGRSGPLVRGSSSLHKTAFLFRTNRITPLLEQNLQRFVKQFPGQVFVVADVSEKPMGPLACECLTIDIAWARGMGLATDMHRPLHMNGDYFYYRALQALPHFENFWLMDDDVYLHTEDLAGFFECMATVQADFLGAHFIRKPWFWGWTSRASALFGSPARCFFPVSRLGRKAIEVLLAERLRQSTLALGKGWINDEAFVAGCVVEKGLVAADMNEVCSAYTWTGFNWKARHRLASLQQQPPDRRFYHSVSA